MTKLPEPAYSHWGHGLTTVTGYSEAQMLQFRRDALEEAALVCYTVKEWAWDHSSPPGQYETTASQAIECADAIRKLKAKP
jgi:hypothetical protein